MGALYLWCCNCCVFLASKNKSCFCPLPMDGESFAAEQRGGIASHTLDPYKKQNQCTEDSLCFVRLFAMCMFNAQFAEIMFLPRSCV